MKIRSIGKRILIRLFSFGAPRKEVLFDSFGGAQYSADPRAVSEKMHELFPDYELAWVLNENAREKNAMILPDYVKIVDGRIGYVKELAKSAAYVTTEPLTESFYKRKGQFVVQTWHGDRGIKKVLYEAAESSGKIRNRIYDDEYTDICVTSSDYGEDMYRKAFGFTGEILKEGMPKNDRLVNFSETERQRLLEFFKIPKGYKILTYAPTFRGHFVHEQSAGIDINRSLDALETRGENWICLLRAHEYTRRINFEGSRERIVDVSKYPDMADILLVTDLLITDYSSCAGDFLVRRKPIILAINDEEEYQRTSRSLRVDLTKTGFILSHNQSELERILKYTADEEYVAACNRALRFYGTVETGHASQTICERINKHYLNYTKRR